MSLDYDLGIELIHTAIEKNREDKIYQQWVAQLPAMSMTENPIGFEDYRSEVLGLNIDRRPTYVIMNELDEIERNFTERRKK